MIPVKRTIIVAVGGLLFWIIMEKLGIYEKIEKMI